MEWSDEAFVLAVRRHGESSAVVMLLTREHGRHAGLVRGGAGKSRRGVLQTGNRLLLRWRARLEEQLGYLDAIELVRAHAAAALDDAARLAALAAACALVEETLPEREPHPAVFAGLAALLETLPGEAWAGAYVRWEIGLLGELGFGLDLARCAATGATDDLAWVSPRTGRAVSRAAGAAYEDRLLALPGFLLAGGEASAAEALAGLALSAHFLDRHVLGPHGKALPAARTRLVDRLRRSATIS